MDVTPVTAGERAAKAFAERLGMTYEIKTELRGKQVDRYVRAHA